VNSILRDHTEHSLIERLDLARERLEEADDHKLPDLREVIGGVLLAVANYLAELREERNGGRA